MCLFLHSLVLCTAIAGKTLENTSAEHIILHETKAKTYLKPRLWELRFAPSHTKVSKLPEFCTEVQQYITASNHWQLKVLQRGGQPRQEHLQHLHVLFAPVPTQSRHQLELLEGWRRKGALMSRLARLIGGGGGKGVLHDDTLGASAWQVNVGEVHTKILNIGTTE